MNTGYRCLIRGLIVLTIMAAIGVVVLPQMMVSYAQEEESTEPAVMGPATPEAAEDAAEDTTTAVKLDFSSYFPDWAGIEPLGMGVAIWQFIVAFLFVLLGLVLKKVSDFMFRHRVIPLLKKTPFEFDNLFATVVSKPLGFLLLIGGLAGAFAVLPLPKKANVFVFGVIKVFIAADVVWFMFRGVDTLVESLGKLASRTESTLDDQLIPLLRKALKVTIGVLGLVWMLDNLGYTITGLLAGLGVGGLAVGLALKETLSDFIGAICIFVERPFSVGDRIKVGDVDGTVEVIGFRSTRIRTLPATLVSIPNRMVTSKTIDNLSKRPIRRVKQTVGVTYETTAEQMEEAVAAIRKIVEEDEGVDKGFVGVGFSDFGDSSLNIDIFYFTSSVIFVEHLATRERINLAIMRKLRDMGLSIAFPTRTVYLEGNIAGEMLKDADQAK